LQMLVEQFKGVGTGYAGCHGFPPIV